MAIDDQLVATASELTGERKTTALMHMGLEALIAREVAHRLARLGGSDPDAETPPHRRARPGM